MTHRSGPCELYAVPAWSKGEGRDVPGGSNWERQTRPTLFLLADALAAASGDEMMPVEGSKNSVCGHVARLSRYIYLLLQSVSSLSPMTNCVRCFLPEAFNVGFVCVFKGTQTDS